MLRIFGLLVLQIVGSIACWGGQPQDQRPLNEDQLMLVLMGSASTHQKIQIIQTQRGNIRWSAEFISRLSHACIDIGLEERVRGVLKALPVTDPGKTDRARTTEVVDSNVASSGAPIVPEPNGVPPIKSSCQPNGLAAPDASAVRAIVDAFYKSDEELNLSLNSYNYHQSYDVKEFLQDGYNAGRHFQEWDVVFGDDGKRLSRETAPVVDTMAGLPIQLIARRGHEFEELRPLYFAEQSRSEYVFTYLDHVRLDQVSAYKFSVFPVSPDKRNPRFSGTIWIEDQDFALVKAEGQSVPDSLGRSYTVQPHFVDFRSQLDGKHWFPVLTVAEVSINGVRLHEVVKFSDYRRFGSTVNLRMVN